MIIRYVNIYGVVLKLILNYYSTHDINIYITQTVFHKHGILNNESTYDLM